MTQEKPRFKNEARGLRRKVVTEAALATFAEKGCFMTSVTQVADRAGVAVGTVYGHYPSKTKLLEAALKEGIEQALNRWSDLDDGSDIRRSLVRLTEGLLIALREHDFLSPVIDGRLPCGLRWSGGDDSPIHVLEDLVISLLDRAETQAQVRSGTDKRLLAQLFLSYFRLSRVKERLESGESASLAEELSSYFLAGLS